MTWIVDDNGRRWVEPVERKRRAHPKAKRFAHVKAGDWLEGGAWEAFGVSRQNVSLHLINIFNEGELDEAAVCKESLLTGRDGKRYSTKLYNLNALM